MKRGRLVGPPKPVVHLAYGTAGFRAKAELLDMIADAIGRVATERMTPTPSYAPMLGLRAPVPKDYGDIHRRLLPLWPSVTTILGEHAPARPASRVVVWRTTRST